MLFNSLTFVGFFAIAYAAYLMLQGRLRAQNGMLLVASLIFYGAWDYRFLALLIGTIAVDFTAARLMEGATPNRRRALLVTAIVASLAGLGFFKYFDFFATSTAGILSALGFSASYTTLNIVLPIGISFYTFQAMSYTIDVYRGKLPAERDPVSFALFVAFFPQLVAGPIERAGSLLAQIKRARTITADRVNAALWLLAWGFFKKVVVADNVASVADEVFEGYGALGGADLALGILAFTIQIYCDFSGYSDIARGLAKLMGFDLMVNFHFPYMALTPSDFWSRWHISLSTWLRDYLYIPLGGNRGGRLATSRNLMVTMALGGLWHGAAWNYVAWGVFHGGLLIAYRLVGPVMARAIERPGWTARQVQRLTMLAAVVVGWVMFRARSFEQIVYMLSNVGLAASEHTADLADDLVFFAVPFVVVEVGLYLADDALLVARLHPLLRAAAYAALLVWILIFGARTGAEFIYFQF